jgi:hypothetical protein
MLKISLFDTVTGAVFCRADGGRDDNTSPVISMPTGSLFRIRMEASSDGFKPVSLALHDTNGKTLGSVTYSQEIQRVETRGMVLSTLLSSTDFSTDSFSFFDIRDTDALLADADAVLKPTDRIASLTLRLQMFAEVDLDASDDKDSGMGLGLNTSEPSDYKKSGRTEFKAKRHALERTFARMDARRMYNAHDDFDDHNRDLSSRDWVAVGEPTTIRLSIAAQEQDDALRQAQNKFALEQRRRLALAAAQNEFESTSAEMARIHTVRQAAEHDLTELSTKLAACQQLMDRLKK